MKSRRWLVWLLASGAACILLVSLAYWLPPVHDRLAWRVDSLRVKIQRLINPPEKQVFTPAKTELLVTPMSAGNLQPSATVTMEAAILPTRYATETTTLPLTPSPTPLPGQVQLTGVRHEYQQFNNCGPATLAMGLSYWGWQGDQRDTRLFLRPNFATVDDKNVNPWEMVKFIEGQAGLAGLNLQSGDLELLKRLLAAGFPVIVEIGIQQHPGDWMGHYVLLTGYDDERSRFITQDSLVGSDLPLDYTEFMQGWRAFNNTYVVAFPRERQAELSHLVNPAAALDSYRLAGERARTEVETFSGDSEVLDRFFALYNLGASLTALGEYETAAQAFDQAFSAYAAIPEEDRPWRIVWYRAEPLEAYYQTGRYQDVINLGNQALDSAGGPLLEESFYWLGRAREATGDLEKALYDYRKAVEINPHSTPAQSELERLGGS
jgi:tetratricopeptide (TPR) repeat protein